MAKPIITILTDFGQTDAYVAQMKGVILSICPDVELVDICHEVPMNHVGKAIQLLRDTYYLFPKGTIHLVVIDPEVGMESRKPIVVKGSNHLFVGPDNGLFGFLYDLKKLQEVREITNEKLTLPQPSKTFHGRDIFAPTAAHLAAGFAFGDVGPHLSKLKKLKEPKVLHTGQSVQGQVTHIDHFGNLVTNMGPVDLQRLSSRIQHGKEVFVEFHSQYLPIRDTFGETDPGTPVAYWGSRKLLEIAVNRSSAADHFKSGEGDRVSLVAL